MYINPLYHANPIGKQGKIASGVLCVLQEKISLICLQIPHEVHAMRILLFDPAVNFLYFLLT